MITFQDIMEIGTKVDNNVKQFGEYFVKRINITDFQVIKNGTVIFEGEDEEIIDFLNNEA